jgi:phenylpyruvate tautomerase PptA (4-oxalocrotonate tautomerase family)
MPLIQIDVQPLGDEQRRELLARAVAAVMAALGTPGPYVSIVIRESVHSNLVEAGGSGEYERREPVPLMPTGAPPAGG